MKTFGQVSVELNEAKNKLPSGHKEVKTDTSKIGSQNLDIVYASYKGKIHVFVNNNLFTGDAPYKDLKTAEKEFKDIKKVMKNMGEEFDVNIEEIVNEINS